MVEKFVQKFYQLSDDSEEMEADEDDDPDDIAEIFKIEGNLFDYETPTYEEYELNNNMTRDLTEPWSDNWGHKWYNELADGKLKVEALMHKTKVEESWGDATPGVIKFCAWLKSSFEILHEVDHDVLVKLEECWWKNYGANNVGDTQGCQERKEEHNMHTESSKPAHDPSIC
ncbi:hypothetical protein Tco_0685536 [Tanacetum coccineum]